MDDHDESPAPLGFPTDYPVRDLIQIQQAGKIIASMDKDGNITVFPRAPQAQEPHDDPPYWQF